MARRSYRTGQSPVPLFSHFEGRAAREQQAARREQLDGDARGAGGAGVAQGGVDDVDRGRRNYGSGDVRPGAGRITSGGMGIGPL